MKFKVKPISKEEYESKKKLAEEFNDNHFIKLWDSPYRLAVVKQKSSRVAKFVIQIKDLEKTGSEEIIIPFDKEFIVRCLDEAYRNSREEADN